MRDVRAAATAALLVGAVAWIYRFNALGGSLGGFGNDQFIQLARARQIVGGDVPYRDFLDPGAPLLSGVSAFVQWLGGYNLLGEAVFTIGALAVGASLTVLLAARLTGRVWPGVIAALLQIGLAPRLYNYPKIILPAIGIWLCWRYADVPSRSRLIPLAAWIVIAFLFRHDFLIYFGVLTALTIALVNRSIWRRGVSHAALGGVCALAFVSPFLIFVQMAGGLPEYLRQAVAFSRADTERTSFHRPTFDFSGLTPLVSMAPAGAPPPARINVRWTPELTPLHRQILETQYRLAAGEQREGSTWNYSLADTSSRNIQALVRDRAVIDTHGIDRSTFTLVGSPPSGWGSMVSRIRIAPAWVREQNLVAWLYYTLVALPLLAAGVWIVRARSSLYEERERMKQIVPYIWPVIALSALLAIGFLSRGTVTARLADVGVPASLLAAWLIGDRVLITRLTTYRIARVVGLVILVLSVWSVALVGAVRPTALRSKLDSPADTLDRTRLVWQTLERTPPVASLDSKAPLARAARYIARCTPPDARLFILGNLPELYFFSGRMFAGGHSWIVPGYASSPVDQQLIVDRLRRYEVPLVLTEPEPRFGAEYKTEFPLVVDYLASEYEDVGALPVAEALSMRVHSSRRVRWSGNDADTGLPCRMERRGR